ncbi:MAG: arylesterase [Acetobacteraceae bacterium]
MAAAYGDPTRRKKGRLSRRSTILAALTAVNTVISPRLARAEPVRLLVLGDSLTAGYGLPRAEGFQARLAQALADRGIAVRIIDGAVSGDTSAGGRARLDWVLAEGADAAIVELGANDGLRGLDPARMEANLAAILDRLAELRIPVLFTGMYAPPNLGPDYQAAFRGAYDRLGRRDGVIYDPFFLDGVASVPALNQDDRLHPNAAGVRHIVDRLLPLVERLVRMARPA